MATRQPPAEAARINWNHPLARGLTHALLPSSSGAKSLLLNIADQTNNFAGSTATYGQGAGRHGRHIEKTAAAFANTHLTSKVQASFVRGNSGLVVLNSASIAASAQQTGFVGFLNQGSGFYADGTGKLLLRVASTVVATGATTVPTTASIVGWSGRDADYHVYLDGLDDTATSSALLLGPSGGIDRCGGPYSGGSGQNQHAFALILQWDRFLTADEQASLARNPWQIFATPTRVKVGAVSASGNTIDVPAGSLTLTGFAPTVVQTANNVIAVPAGTLTLTGQTPTVVASDHKSVAVPAGSLTLTGQTPTVVVGSPSDPQTISVPAGSLTITGFAPTIVQTANNVVSVPAGTLTLTGLTPTVTATAHNVIAVPVGTLTLSPFAPVVNPVADVAPTTPVVGGGSARRRRPHFVEIDGELFPVEDEAEAIAILEQAQELHEEIVQKAKVQKAKPPAKPVVRASLPVADVVKAIDTRHEEAMRAYLQMLDDDDEDVFLLL